MCPSVRPYCVSFIQSLLRRKGEPRPVNSAINMTVAMTIIFLNWEDKLTSALVDRQGVLLPAQHSLPIAAAAAAVW